MATGLTEKENLPGKMTRRQLLGVSAKATLASGVGLLSSGSKSKEPSTEKRQSATSTALCLNEDNSHFFYSRAGKHIDSGVIDSWVDQYAGTAVRELMICPNCMRTSYDSKVWDPIWRGYDPTGGDDQPLLASRPTESRSGDRGWIHTAWQLHHEGVDIYERWMDRCRQKNISPWISMRMNDVHFTNDENCFIHSEFWRENPHLRRVKYRFSESVDRAFDYGNSQVRDYHMKLIRELVERYDFDGLELDWMRFGFHFRPGHEAEGVPILTQFTATVRSLLDEWQKKRGHRIRLGARIPSRPETALGLGMDGVTWAQRGLVDMLVVTPFWASIEPDMPIELWKRLLVGTHVTLAAGLELLVRPFPEAIPQYSSLEVIRGAAATLLDRGADRIYLFNYMDSDTTMVDVENYSAMLREAGRLSTLVGKARRHVLTYSDTWAPGEPRALPLPATCLAGKWSAFRLPIGPRPNTERAGVRLGIENGVEKEVRAWEVRVNGSRCDYATQVQPAFTRPDHALFTFSIPPGALNRGYNLVELRPETTARAVWIEIALEPS